MDMHEVLWSELEKKEKKSLLLRRPVKRLYPLEVQDTKMVNRDVKSEGKRDVKEIDCKPARRRAAVEADEKRKLIDKVSEFIEGV